MIIFSGLGRVRSFNFPDPAMGVAPHYLAVQNEPARSGTKRAGRDPEHNRMEVGESEHLRTRKR